MPGQPNGESQLLEFSLRTVAGLLQTVVPPEGYFDPSRPWTHAYRVHSTASTIVPNRRPVGMLTVGRLPAPGGQFDLHISYRKSSPRGHEHRMNVESRCVDDTLATPLQWSVTSETRDPDGTPVAQTPLRTSGACKHGVIELQQGGARRQIQAPAAWTGNWSLFEAVQRLAGQGMQPVEFALLDQLEVLKPRQTLSLRTTADVEIGGRKVPLRAYQHLGDAILPLIYWTDLQGRLLLMTSGIQALLWGDMPT